MALELVALAMVAPALPPEPILMPPPMTSYIVSWALAVPLTP